MIDDALRRPLLMIHGLADDNVFVANTLRLSRASRRRVACTPWCRCRGITLTTDEAVAENLLLLQVRFLKQALGIADPSRKLGSLQGHCYARRDMPIIVQKYGGTSVDGVDRLRAVADRVVRARDAGNDVIVVVSAMGRPRTTSRGWPRTSPSSPIRARWTCSSRRGSASRWRSGDRDQPAGCRAASYTGSQAGIIGHRPRPGEDHRDPPQADPRGARGRQRRDHRGVPGVVLGVRDHDARPRRLRPHRGRDGGGRGRRGLRDLHRRRGVMTATSARGPRGELIERIGYDDMLELAAAGPRLQSRAPWSWPDGTGCCTLAPSTTRHPARGCRRLTIGWKTS